MEFWLILINQVKLETLVTIPVTWKLIYVFCSVIFTNLRSTGTVFNLSGSNLFKSNFKLCKLVGTVFHLFII